MKVLEHLEPKQVFYFFEEISRIPRGSGNEKAISDYIVGFAANRGLACVQDKANNILIRKPGAFGYETSPTIILQGHLDMVCEKEKDYIHDFTKDPLQLQIDEDFISAKGTTLGADNGIAVAFMLAILDAKDISHPPIEAVFTTDEEVGMGGASAFDTSLLTGKRFINMDTEEEGKLLVSCCGGMRAKLTMPIVKQNAEEDAKPYTLLVGGLLGGHSGADIHKQRANANKLMGRILFHILNVYHIGISSIHGGAMDNAICREAEAVVLFSEKDEPAIRALLRGLEEILRHEYRTSDKDIFIKLAPLPDGNFTVFSEKCAKDVISVLLLTPYGVQTMSPDMEGLVESSNNLGIVKTSESEISFTSALRSNVASRKYVILDQIKELARLVGGNVTTKGDYPAWEYNPNSELLKIFQRVYEEAYDKPAQVEAIHAGLECGLFGEKMKDLDMISIGPEMYDVHTTNERLSISSTARVWDYVLRILKQLKE